MAKGLRLGRRVVALLCIGFGRLTRLLPLPVARALTTGLGRIAFHAVPRIRRVGLENLDRAFGDVLSRAEKLRILRGSVRNVALVAAEFSRTPCLPRGGMERYVRFEGLQHVDFSRPFLAIGAHLGNWEWMAPAVASRGCRVAEVVRPLDDPWLNRYVDGRRRGGGVETIEKDAAARNMVKWMREGGLAGILVDQSPRENAVPATFFGHACWATAGPVLIALRVKAPVHPVSMARNADGTYTLCFHPEVEFARTGDLRGDLMVNAQRCQDALEALVRAWPEQWLWFHRRWKNRPRLEAEWHARAARESAEANLRE